MVDAGILDGDTVIVEECDTADPGTIVVALVDREEVTLKRLRRNKGSIALEAANPAYETRIFPPDRVQIQGRLVGLLRRYCAGVVAPVHGRSPPPSRPGSHPTAAPSQRNP